MASLINVRLSKGDSPNLGFRLQGGKDFATPLIIQKVNPGSPAERAGLTSGDAVIKINNTDVFNLKHKDAQDVVVRAGPAFEMTIQRGGLTWKPSVVPVGPAPKPSPSINNVSPVTKTSLAKNPSENIGAIGTGHNLSAKPFGPQLNGAVNGGPKLVNKQYNSPVHLYSEDSIAETLAAQSEVLASGAVGVNFKKNERNYDASNSAVLRVLKETENEPKSPDEEPDSGVVTASNSGIAGLRRVQAPETRPQPANAQLPPGQNICDDCERLIVGVFVRIKDKNLHVECFKCSTCGTSLKNVGYYNISNKLYCDIHAKSAAIRSNANPNLVPVTVSPGSKAPAHAISSALSSHSLPSPSPLSPKLNNNFGSPYQPQETKENFEASTLTLANSNVTEANHNNIYSPTAPLSFSKYVNKSSNFSGPKPFSSVSAPLSPQNSLPRSGPLSPNKTLPRTGPLSPGAPISAPSYNSPSFSPASSAGRFSSIKPSSGLFKDHCAPSITWPPPQEEPDIPTACPLFYPPPSKVESHILQKRSEREELEVDCNCLEVEAINTMAGFVSSMSDNLLIERKSATECIETISETLETQKLVENVLRNRTDIPPAINADIRTSALESKQELSKFQEESVGTCPASLPDNICCQKKDSCELKRPAHFSPLPEMSTKIQNTVPLKWESPLLQALRTTSPDPDTFSLIPQKRSGTPLASALTIAPQDPFTPFNTSTEIVPLPEETVPYFPPERPILPVKEEEPEQPPEPEIIECKPSRKEKPISRFVKALEQAPERPSPVGGVSVLPRMKAKLNEKSKKTNERVEEKQVDKPEEKPKPISRKNDPFSKYFEDLPTPQEKLSLSSALTIAPDRPYSPLIVESIALELTESSKKSQDVTKSAQNKPIKTAALPDCFKINKKDPRPPGYYPPEALQSMIEENHSQQRKSNLNETQITRASDNPGNNPTSIYYQKTEQNESEELKEESDTTKIKSIERQTIQNPQLTQIITSENQTAQFAPIFQGFSCSFRNKSDHSQINVEISTTPPLLNAPAGPVVKTIESQQGYIEKETITEEKRERQQKTKRKEENKEEIRSEIKYAKQSEEVILKKAQPLVRLHKTDQVPQYQVQIREEAEADIQFQEKVENARMRFEQQKQESAKVEEMLQKEIQTEAMKKPIIMIQPDETTSLSSQNTFKPVVENRPPNQTFSPRPASISPSLINKHPPTLPYYQANLVPQHMEPPKVNYLDPKSPATSRSPSPCPGGRRSPCPGNTYGRSSSPSPSRGGSNIRPVSPAQGPPANPLRSPEPLPTPDNTKKVQARENITTFIPEYKSKRDVIERIQGMEFFEKSDSTYEAMQGSTNQPTQMYTSTVQTQNYPASVQLDYRRDINAQQTLSNQQLYQSQMMDIQEAQKAQRYSSQTADGTVTKAVNEQSRKAHMEQMQKSQSQSVERSSDGLTQIQRKKVVTEEYERTQKDTNIQIEKNITRNSGFQRINAPPTEAPTGMGMHITNPHPMTLSSRQQSQQQIEQVTQQSCSQKASSLQGVAAQTTVQPSGSFPIPAPASDEPTLPSAIKKVYPPSSIAPAKHVSAPSASLKKPSQKITAPDLSQSDTGAAGGRQAGGISVAPRRGRGVLNAAALAGARIPLCGSCNMQIRGPFITALGKIWCPNHFICATPSCRRPLQDLGFVEEKGQLYCEYCFEQYLAPPCAKCSAKIKGDCLKAIGKNFHPECFNCVYCGKLFANSPFFLEDGSPYCEADWNELFTTKCFACGFPVEAGDRWVEALNNNYHSQCFNCTMCKKNLEGQSFFAKGGRPFCKNHAR